jgi:hypothetical protein
VEELDILQHQELELVMVALEELEQLYYLFQLLNIQELQLDHQQLQHQVQILLLLGLQREVIQHELF